MTKSLMICYPSEDSEIDLLILNQSRTEMISKILANACFCRVSGIILLPLAIFRDPGGCSESDGGRSAEPEMKSWSRGTQLGMEAKVVAICNAEKRG